MYRVRLEGSPEGQRFDFVNYDDALNFASMAMAGGMYQDYHYITTDEGSAKVWDDPHHLEVRLVEVDD
jgi:hypothetical protein